MSGPSLIVLALSAPSIGISVRWPQVMHAITMEGLPIKTWPKGSATAACGKTGLRIMDNGNGYPAPWPPAVKGLAPRHTRCPKCFQATGKPRPKCRLERAGDSQ